MSPRHTRRTRAAIVAGLVAILSAAGAAWIARAGAGEVTLGHAPALFTVGVGTGAVRQLTRGPAG